VKASAYPSESLSTNALKSSKWEEGLKEKSSAPPPKRHSGFYYQIEPASPKNFHPDKDREEEPKEDQVGHQNHLFPQGRPKLLPQKISIHSAERTKKQT
jgi:hypothetical protein